MTTPLRGACSRGFSLGAALLLSACGGSVSSPGGGTPASAQGCGSESITFKLVVAPNSATRFCVADSSSACVLTSWLGIQHADGTPLPIDSGRCTPSCSACEPTPCTNLCASPAVLDTQGLTYEFHGNSLVFDTCGQGTTCVGSQCAAPGDYVASVCGYPDQASGDSSPCSDLATNEAPICIDLPFTWPPTTSGTTLVGTVGAEAVPGN